MTEITPKQALKILRDYLLRTKKASNITKAIKVVISEYAKQCKEADEWQKQKILTERFIHTLRQEGSISITDYLRIRKEIEMENNDQQENAVPKKQSGQRTGVRKKRTTKKRGSRKS